MITQGLVLLTDGSSSIDAVRSALVAAGIEILQQRPAHLDWRFSGPDLTIAFRPEVHGVAVIDVVDQPWPDAMGDPETDAKTFGAWMCGHFGPFAHPDGLKGAVRNGGEWDGAGKVVDRHRGFIRLRLSYVCGEQKNPRFKPENYEPLAELDFLGRAVLLLLDVPGVLCYFNPNGEVLLDPPRVRAAGRKKPPLDLWVNSRYYPLTQELTLMDTVGNGQMDLPDLEALFLKGSHSREAVATYLRKVTEALVKDPQSVRPGRSIFGADVDNKPWVVESVKPGCAPPLREMLRLLPKKDAERIRERMPDLG